MDRRISSKSLGFAWHSSRERSPVPRASIEYYGYPSEMARETFNHVTAIGKARCPPRHEMQRQQGILGYLIHYVNRGQYWHRIRNRVFRVGEGGACLLDLSKPFAQGNDQAQAADLWWIRFGGREIPRMVAQLGADLNPVFDHIPRRRFQSLFRQLWTLTVRKPAGHEAQAHAILAAILAELFIARSRQADIARQLGNKARVSERMHAAIDYITARAGLPIGLKDIAAAVGLNLYHFARRFRREVGVSPIQFLNRSRIEQAKPLLATTDKTVAEVGRLVGIPDPGYFARLFRKRVGESPQSWRARNARGR